jgi:hypothetical protein
MVSQLELKRVLCAMGLMSATVMLAVGLMAHTASANANSEGKFPAPMNARYVACSSNMQRNERPKPWLKIVVSHVISVATRLAI